MINLRNAKAGQKFITVDGEVMVYTGYRDIDGDYHLVSEDLAHKKLYRVNGEHGGYTQYVADSPRFDLVKSI